MATVEIPARRGHYLAQLDGEDPKMGLAREFSNGTKISGKRVYRHTLGPGFYEIQRVLPVAERPAACSECGRRSDGKVREYFAITTGDAIEDLTEWAGSIGSISEGPPLDGPYHPPATAERDTSRDDLPVPV